MVIKRIFSVIFIFFLLCIFIPSSDLKANSGPPSNLSVVIENASFDYYFEILIYQEAPLSLDQMDGAESSPFFTEGLFDDYLYPLSHDMPEMLISFQDDDAYVSNTLYGGFSYFYANQSPPITPDQFVLFLDVPRIFKLMLISDQDEVILSEVIEMKTYDYQITWDLEGITFEPGISYDQGNISGFIEHPLLRPSTYFDFFVRLIVTLLIELGILYLFGFRLKVSYYIVFGINVLTQSILTIGTLSVFYSTRFSLLAPIVFFIVGEFFVFLSEMIIFGFTLKEKHPFKRVIYAFTANLVSMIIGFIVTMWIFTNLIM